MSDKRLLNRVLIVAVVSAVAGLMPLTSQAGITLTNPSGNIVGFGTYTASAGVDPAVFTPHRITLNAPAGGSVFSADGATITFNQPIQMTQSYSPLVGPLFNSAMALSNTTTITLENSSDVAVTLDFEVVFDTYNYPYETPLGVYFTSTIGSTQLTEGATFTSTDTLTPPGGAAGTIIHAPLSGFFGGSDPKQLVVTGTSAPFSITQRIQVYLPGYATANIQVSNSVTAVPEPSSLAMLLGASTLLCVGRRLRKAFLVPCA